MSTYLRFADGTGACWGAFEGSKVRRLTAAPWESPEAIGAEIDPESLSLLAPVTPSKIVLVGLNYQAHVAESKSADKAPDEPVIFMKPLTALVGPGEAIVRPAGVERVDYEAELAVVIGKELRCPSLAEAAEAVFGATCLNDVTARPLQRKDVQWTRAKGFDTFCPVGPYLVSGADWQSVQVESFVNGERRQSGNTRDQIFPVAALVKFVADVMTVYPGDLISTGTPEGVGPLAAGDEVEIRVEGIGSLKNPVKDAE